MKILLIEDEYHAVKYLSSLLKEHLPGCTIIAQLESVEDAIQWIENNDQPDLAFVDVQLADGLSFEIFQKVEIKFPIIFTTAFDEYTLEAFKVNSIDYLLKPVGAEELQHALKKFDTLYQQQTNSQVDHLASLMKDLLKPNTNRQRFLIKSGKDYTVLHTTDLAYFYSEDGITFTIDRLGKRHLIDQSIEKLERELDPINFYRINRKMIVQVHAVNKIHSYFNHRLKLDLHPEAGSEVIVSRDRVKNFKDWLDQ